MLVNVDGHSVRRIALQRIILECCPYYYDNAFPRIKFGFSQQQVDGERDRQTCILIGGRKKNLVSVVLVRIFKLRLNTYIFPLTHNKTFCLREVALITRGRKPSSLKV